MFAGEAVDIVMFLFARQEIVGRNFTLLDNFGVSLIRFGDVVVEKMAVEDPEAEIKVWR